MNELGKMVRLKSCLVSDRIVNFDAPKVDQKWIKNGFLLSVEKSYFLDSIKKR